MLSPVPGILGGRGLNTSLFVVHTELRDLSRMCIAISGQDGVIEQACLQPEEFVRPLLPSPNPS
jgi:acetolactate synthase small subunit